MTLISKKCSEDLLMEFLIYTLFFVFVVGSNAHKDIFFILIVIFSILLIITSIYELFEYKFIMKIKDTELIVNTSNGPRKINLEDIKECSLINSNRKEILYISVENEKGIKKNVFIKQEEIFVRLKKVENAINNLIKK